VTQKDKFVIEMIVNVIMLIKLDKNISKISFFDVNVNNFLLDENVNNFLLEENINNTFYLNVNTFHSTKNVNKLPL